MVFKKRFLCEAKNHEKLKIKGFKNSKAKKHIYLNNENSKSNKTVWRWNA